MLKSLDPSAESTASNLILSQQVTQVCRVVMNTNPWLLPHQVITPPSPRICSSLSSSMACCSPALLNIFTCLSVHHVQFCVRQCFSMYCKCTVIERRKVIPLSCKRTTKHEYNSLQAVTCDWFYSYVRQLHVVTEVFIYVAYVQYVLGVCHLVLSVLYTYKH